MAQDPLPWLATNVRDLLSRIAALERALERTEKDFAFNNMALNFFPRFPPGVHAPDADVQFAAALFMCYTLPSP